MYAAFHRPECLTSIAVFRQNRTVTTDSSMLLYSKTLVKAHKAVY